jgi:hypothetical protein
MKPLPLFEDLFKPCSARGKTNAVLISFPMRFRLVAFGTAETLSSVEYSVKNGVINQLAPGVFCYWLKVTVPAGNNSFTITETITTANFSAPIALANGGSNVFNNNCNRTLNTITQGPNTGTVTVSFNAPTAGDYFISLKYQPQSLKGANAPWPTTTVHYDLVTTQVPGSASGIDLVRR